MSDVLNHFQQTPTADIDINEVSRMISKKLKWNKYRRYLRLILLMDTREIDKLLPLPEETLLRAIQRKIERMNEEEKTLFFRSYAAKMNQNTKADLQEAQYKPDEKLTTKFIYQLIDCIPNEQRDFLLKMGVTLDPLEDYQMTPEQFQTVVKSWWQQQAE